MKELLATLADLIQSGQVDPEVGKRCRDSLESFAKLPATQHGQVFANGSFRAGTRGRLSLTLSAWMGSTEDMVDLEFAWSKDGAVMVTGKMITVVYQTRMGFGYPARTRSTNFTKMTTREWRIENPNGTQLGDIFDEIMGDVPDCYLLLCAAKGAKREGAVATSA